MLNAHQTQWLKFFPGLNSIDNPAWNKMLERSKPVALNKGQIIFRDGESCKNYLFIISGIIRVHKTTKDGHEIILYRLRTGQVCEITTTCLLANNKYHAEAVAESPANIILVPKLLFQEALSGIPEFQTYVFSGLEKGVNGLIGLIEDVAFGPMDSRLAIYLLNNVNAQGFVNSTHHDIAASLGTAREVISRNLKKFEKNNWVKLSRGKILLLDTESLKNICKVIN